MPIPSYYRSHGGRVFRVQRIHTPTDGGVRYVLRASTVKGVENAAVPVAEVAQEVSTEVVREKIRLRQAVPTAEQCFEQLWQQLRLELDGQ